MTVLSAPAAKRATPKLHTPVKPAATPFKAFRPTSRVRWEMIRITVEIALEMLRANSANRPMNARNFDSICTELRAGTFPVDLAPIRFDRNGVLIDGQHRLQAIVETGVAIETLVIFGLEPEIFKKIDQGKKRDWSDDLATMGYGDPNGLGAAAALLWRFQRHAMLRTDLRPTRSDVIQTVLDNPGLVDSLRFVSRKAGGLMTRSTAAFLHYIFSRVDSHTADYFFTVFGTGAGLTENHPVLRLRNRLVANSATKTSKMIREIVIALSIKAWNLYRADIPCRQLSFKPGTEPYPSLQ